MQITNVNDIKTKDLKVILTKMNKICSDDSVDMNKNFINNFLRISDCRYFNRGVSKEVLISSNNKSFVEFKKDLIAMFKDIN